MLRFTEHVWQSYFLLKNNSELKRKQIELLTPTGLVEHSEGVEFTFVPTSYIGTLHSKLMKLYNSITVEDTTVALCNEVFYTSKIEGANTTLAVTQEIHDGLRNLADICKSERMVYNGFQATKFLNLKNGPLTEETLLKLWNIVIDEVYENENIRGDRYRLGDVQVGNHIGLNYLLVPEAMCNWINYYNSDVLSDYPFIKAALLHYTFEYIHPFCDGNGRTGRFLMNNYLIKNGLDKIKAVSFSHSIEKDRIEYDMAFKRSANVYTDCTPFIEYMLTVMLDAFQDVTSTASEIFKEYATKYNISDDLNLQSEIQRFK